MISFHMKNREIDQNMTYNMMFETDIPMLFGSPSSKSILHGFLSPIDQISPLAPALPTKGLSEGMAYCLPPSCLLISIRIIFPSSDPLKIIINCIIKGHLDG